MPDLVIRPEAELDITQAATWYEQERDELARVFLAELQRILASIVESPERFPRVRRGARRALLRRFPYGVFFIADGELVTVLAVVHLHRNPAAWQKRVTG